MREIIVKRTDDLDHRTITDVQEVKFSLEGVDYAIDLAPRNVEYLRRQLQPFTENGRILPPPARKRPDVSEIRHWAQQNGYASARGRLSAEARWAFYESHGWNDDTYTEAAEDENP